MTVKGWGVSNEPILIFRKPIRVHKIYHRIYVNDKSHIIITHSGTGKIMKK